MTKDLLHFFQGEFIVAARAVGTTENSKDM